MSSEVIGMVESWSYSPIPRGTIDRITWGEARRQIIELHKAWIPSVHYKSDLYCSTCGDIPQVDYPCETLRAVALPYADHPDFDPTWLVGGQGD